MNRYDIALDKESPEMTEHAKVLQRSEAHLNGPMDILSSQSLDDVGRIYGVTRRTEIESDTELQQRLLDTVRGTQGPRWGAVEDEALRSVIDGIPRSMAAPVIRPDTQLHTQELAVEVVIPDEMMYQGRPVDVTTEIQTEAVARDRARGLIMERLDGYINYDTREEASQLVRILRASIYVALP